MPTRDATSWIAPLGAMQEVPILLTGNSASMDWVPSLFFDKSSTAKPHYDDDDEAWVMLSEESLAMWADENPYDEDS